MKQPAISCSKTFYRNGKKNQKMKIPPVFGEIIEKRADILKYSKNGETEVLCNKCGGREKFKNDDIKSLNIFKETHKNC